MTMDNQDGMIAPPKKTKSVCTACNNTFWSLSDYANHFKWCGPHKCKVCNRMFMETASLTKHMISHKNILFEYQCTLCHRKYYARQSLSQLDCICTRNSKFARILPKMTASSQPMSTESLQNSATLVTGALKPQTAATASNLSLIHSSIALSGTNRQEVARDMPKTTCPLQNVTPTPRLQCIICKRKYEQREQLANCKCSVNRKSMQEARSALCKTNTPLKLVTMLPKMTGSQPMQTDTLHNSTTHLKGALKSQSAITESNLSLIHGVTALPVSTTQEGGYMVKTTCPPQIATPLSSVNRITMEEARSTLNTTNTLLIGTRKSKLPTMLPKKTEPKTMLTESLHNPTTFSESSLKSQTTITTSNLSLIHSSTFLPETTTQKGDRCMPNTARTQPISRGSVDNVATFTTSALKPQSVTLTSSIPFLHVSSYMPTLAKPKFAQPTTAYPKTIDNIQWSQSLFTPPTSENSQLHSDEEPFVINIKVEE